MTTNNCIREKGSKFILGFLLLIAAAALVALGFTLLPIIGFALAVPVAALAVFIFRAKLNNQCEIDLST